MVLHAVFFLVIVGVEAAVVVQGLAVYGHSLGTGFPDGLDTLPSADVDEIHR